MAEVPPDVTAGCLVGGCDWLRSGPYVSTLLREVEQHRQEKHDWVKPGRLHRLHFPPPPAPEPEPPPQPSGKRARMQHDRSPQRSETRRM